MSVNLLDCKLPFLVVTLNSFLTKFQHFNFTFFNIRPILFCPLSGTRKVRILEAPNIQFSIGNPSVVLKILELHLLCGRDVTRSVSETIIFLTIYLIFDCTECIRLYELSEKKKINNRT